jgi:hypothetical protein
MGITVTSISGGVADPYAGDGTTPPSQQFPNAALENSFFVDRILVDLVYDPTPFTQIKSVAVSYSLTGNSQSLTNLTGGQPLNDIIYVTPTPQSNTSTGLTVTTNIESANTLANITISGNISGSFPDKVWGYTNVLTTEVFTAADVSGIPLQNNRVYLYKPSFMNFVSVLFNVFVEYDTANLNYTVEKRVLNDWEAGRLALLNRLSNE